MQIKEGLEDEGRWRKKTQNKRKDRFEKDDQMASRSVGGVNLFSSASPEWCF